MAKENIQMTMMRCSKKLTSFLKSKALYGETLEEVIWRLINKEKKKQ